MAYKKLPLLIDIMIRNDNQLTIGNAIVTFGLLLFSESAFSSKDGFGGSDSAALLIILILMLAISMIGVFLGLLAWGIDGYIGWGLKMCAGASVLIAFLIAVLLL